MCECELTMSMSLKAVSVIYSCTFYGRKSSVLGERKDVGTNT